MSDLTQSLNDELARAHQEIDQLRNNLHRANLQKLALCEVAQRKLQDFAREFRVPLASVLGFVDLLSVTYKGDTSELNHLAVAAHQLMELVTGLESAQALSLLDDETVAPVPPIATAIPTNTPQPHLVLHVEDNETNFRLVERILEDRSGLKVHWAKSGQDGIVQTVQKNPALVLLDLNLPDIHGSELLHQLKNNPTTKDIPVIIISADVSPTQIERMLQAGASNYLTKPFEIKRLLCLVDEALSIPKAA